MLEFDRTRYLALFSPEKYDALYNRITYLISQKSGFTYVISHNYARIKVDSYDSLTVEEALPFHNVIILIKSVLEKVKIITTMLYSSKMYQLAKNNEKKFSFEIW